MQLYNSFFFQSPHEMRTRPTMSHVSARLEMQSLLSTVMLGAMVGGKRVDDNRDAA
jgi:hypothetical protein